MGKEAEKIKVNGKMYTFRELSEAKCPAKA